MHSDCHSRYANTSRSIRESSTVEQQLDKAESSGVESEGKLGFHLTHERAFLIRKNTLHEKAHNVPNGGKETEDLSC